MDNGALVASGTVATLLQEYAEDVLHITTAERKVPQKIQQELKAYPLVQDVCIHQFGLNIRVKNAHKALPAVATILHDNGVHVKEINHAGVQFQDVYLSLLGKNPQKNQEVFL